MCIPVYDRVSCTLKAVKSALKNNPFEVIVYEDGLSKSTLELWNKMIKDKRVKYVLNPKNLGVNHARNRLAQIAKGDYILYLDSDDVLTELAFKTINRCKLGLINLFYTRCDFTGLPMCWSDKNRIKYSYKEWLEGEVLGGEFLGMYHKSVFSVATFDESMFCFEAHWLNRLVRKFGVYVFPEFIRLYNSDEPNRVSSQMLNWNKLKQRAIDYEKYYWEFSSDLVKYKLTKQLLILMFKVMAYKIVSGNFTFKRWSK